MTPFHGGILAVGSGPSLRGCLTAQFESLAPPHARRGALWAARKPRPPQRFKKSPARSVSLLHQHHRSLPERSLLPRRIYDSYLTVLSPRLQLIQREAEPQRHCLRFRVHSLGDRQWSSLERFRLSAIEGHEGHQRLHRRLAPLIRLQIHVHVAAPAEYPRYARDQLLPVLNQRVYRRRLVLARREQGVLHVHALPAQDHRADRNPFLLLIQVRYYKLIQIGPDPSRFVVARQKLQTVSSRQQCEPGVILDRLLRQLPRSRPAQLDIHLVPYVRHRDVVLVLHFADEIDQRVLRAPLARQRQFAARNFRHHRHEVLRRVQLQVIHLHGDRQLRDRVAQHH